MPLLCRLALLFAIYNPPNAPAHASIKPICIYSVKGKTRVNEIVDEESFGMLFIADISSFEEELHSEREKILMVDNWTYSQIQPKLLEEAKKRGYL